MSSPAVSDCMNFDDEEFQLFLADQEDMSQYFLIWKLLK
jgi:hypothetical protein